MELERWVAFATDPSGGNPAGVALADSRPSVELMQQVAADVGFSETAFLVPLDPGRWWVRYFSPVAEVPFCGHATIASALALAHRNAALSSLVLETSVGVVPVAIHRAGGAMTAVLTSPAAAVKPLGDEDLDVLLSTFGWDRSVLDPALPPAVGHGGADHPVLALRDRATLASMRYAFGALRTMMEHRGWTTIQLVYRQDARTFDVRNPFPVGGVVEDPATGAAAAALGAYLREAGQLEADGLFTVRQGVEIGRPSVLEVDASGTAGVRVGGAGVRLPEELAIPPVRS
jgi:PhzF family phenazine biosynthesis protein